MKNNQYNMTRAIARFTIIRNVKEALLVDAAIVYKEDMLVVEFNHICVLLLRISGTTYIYY